MTSQKTDSAKTVTKKLDIVLPKEDLAKVKHRLTRAQGQLAAVLRAIDENKPCEDVLTQLVATAKALDRAAMVMALAGMECYHTHGQLDSATRTKLEKMFLSIT